MVREVHRKVNHIRYGPRPEEMGGTKIDEICKGIPVLCLMSIAERASSY
jgi:hypothetical protein